MTKITPTARVLNEGKEKEEEIYMFIFPRWSTIVKFKSRFVSKTFFFSLFYPSPVSALLLD
jgi:hypothetical protein